MLDREVNPSIAAHGGHAELVAIDGAIAYLRLGGGCQGCGMATVTLSQGIEVAITEAVPEITASSTSPTTPPAPTPTSNPPRSSGPAPSISRSPAKMPRRHGLHDLEMVQAKQHRVGIIVGLGQTGLPMCARLVERGFAVTATDVWLSESPRP